MPAPAYRGSPLRKQLLRNAPAKKLQAEQLDQVQIDTANLIEGHELRFAMHDQRGVLLLAEGSRITAEFKRRLLTREIMTVRVHQLDSGEPIPEPEVVVEATPDPWGPDVTVGVPFVTNRGPALRSRITRLGARAIDQQFLATLRQEQAGTANLIDQFMNRAEGGREQSAGQLLESIDRAVERLAVDVDAFTSLAISATQPRSLSQHCRDLAHLSMTMATELGLNSENVSKIGMTALLHDWGWLRVPLEIRQLTRPPTRMEMLEIHKHPAYSLDMLEKLNGLPSLIGLVSYQIHEKLDGTGYPRAKSGRNIHLFARIIHVADDYLTLTGATSFRAPLHPSIAMRVLLEQQDGRAADRNVLRALLRALSIFPIGSQVRLSDDTIATVLRANGDNYTRPVVQRLPSPAEQADPNATPEVINLMDSSLRILGAELTSEVLQKPPVTLTGFTRIDEGHTVARPYFAAAAERAQQAATQNVSRNS